MQIKNILKNSGYLVGARGMNMIVRVVYAIALARYLGAENYGLYFYALSWYIVFLPFTSLGLWAVISRDVGQSEEKGKKTVLQSFGLRSILSLVIAFICAVSGLLLHSEILLKQLLILFSISMVGRALAIWVEHVFNAYSQSKYVLRLEMIFRPLEAGVSVLILVMGGGIIELALSHGAFWWIQGLYGYSLLQRNMYKIKPNWEWLGIKRLLSKGVLLGVSSFCIVWFLQGPLILARNSSFDAIELGQLALLLQIFTILSQVPQMIRMAALPILSKPENQEGDSVNNILDLGLKTSWLVGVLAGLVAWYTGPWLVELLFGHEFKTVGNYIGQILFLLVPWTWGNLLWTKLLSDGNVKISTIALVSSCILLTMSFFTLITFLHFDAVIIAMNIGLWSWVIILFMIQKISFLILIKGAILSTIIWLVIINVNNAELVLLINSTFITLGFLFIIISQAERKSLFVFAGKMSKKLINRA